MAESKLSDSWQCGKSVLERNRIMLDRQINTDVTFVFPANVGENIGLITECKTLCFGNTANH